MTIQQIRIRNWQKARLLGIGLDVSVLTEWEKGIWNGIMTNLYLLKENWDGQTEIMVGHPLPPYKCSWCGKRGYKKFEFEGAMYCSKHYKEVTYGQAVVETF